MDVDGVTLPACLARVDAGIRPVCLHPNAPGSLRNGVARPFIAGAAARL